MKKLILSISLILLAAATNGYAADTPYLGDGLFSKLFLAFLAAIIAFQLLPGMTMLMSMIKGLYRKTPTSSITD